MNTKEPFLTKLGKGKTVNKRFIYNFHYLGLKEISLGVNIGLDGPNLELHLPFGFFRVGWYGIWIPEDIAYLELHEIV